MLKDIDDVLRAAGRDAAPALFQKLLADAQPAEEFFIDDLANAPEDKRSERAEKVARILLEWPPLEQARFRKRMAKVLGVGLRTVQQIFKRAKGDGARGFTPASREPSSPMVVDDLRFRWSKRGLEKVEMQEIEGQPVERTSVISNFLIRIERNVDVIDDLGDRREFECRLLLAGDDEDAPGRPITIDARHYGSNARLAEDLFGAGNSDLMFVTKDMDFIRMASNTFSQGKTIRMKAVRYVGYVKARAGASKIYVMPSVVIRDGQVMPAAEAEKELGFRCELPPSAFKSVKHLDLAIISNEEFRETSRHIINDLLRFKDAQIGRVCLAHAFLAPVIRRLNGFRRCGCWRTAAGREAARIRDPGTFGRHRAPIPQPLTPARARHTASARARLPLKYDAAHFESAAMRTRGKSGADSLGVRIPGAASRVRMRCGESVTGRALTRRGLVRRALNPRESGRNPRSSTCFEAGHGPQCVAGGRWGHSAGEESQNGDEAKARALVRGLPDAWGRDPGARTGEVPVRAGARGRGGDPDGA